MKPISADQLARKALAYGARAELDGATVNVSRAQVHSLPLRSVPTPLPPPPAEFSAPAPISHTNNITVDMEPVSRAVESIGPTIANALASLPQPKFLEPAPAVAPRSWVFEMEYSGPNGRLSRVIATPK